MITARNPTMVVACGCPYDPVYDKSKLGWHLTENHLPETFESLREDLRHAHYELDCIARALPNRQRAAEDSQAIHNWRGERVTEEQLGPGQQGHVQATPPGSLNDENPLSAGGSPFMRMRGLEPPRACAHTDLNRARLPIPPHPRGQPIVAAR
jgi:hypothetical protein